MTNSDEGQTYAVFNSDGVVVGQSFQPKRAKDAFAYVPTRLATLPVGAAYTLRRLDAEQWTIVEHGVVPERTIQ